MVEAISCIDLCMNYTDACMSYIYSDLVDFMRQMYGDNGVLYISPFHNVLNTSVNNAIIHHPYQHNQLVQSFLSCVQCTVIARRLGHSEVLLVTPIFYNELFLTELLVCSAVVTIHQTTNKIALCSFLDSRICIL